MKPVSATSEEPTVWLVLDFAADKRGTLEQNLLALATRLRDASVKTTIVLSGKPIDWVATELRDIGVETRILDFRRPYHAAFEFARWLRSSRPDLIHFHFVRAYSPLVLAAHAAGAKVIVHDHLILGKAIIAERAYSPELSRALQPVKRFRGAALNRAIDARIAVSLAVAASIMDAEYFPSERIEVIPNGIDLARFSNADSTLRSQLSLGSRPVVACAVAQMRAEKGVEVLIRAMSAVREDAVLLIAGPPSADCRKLVQQRGLQERVHFLGLRNDVENVFAAANVVVVPSTCEEACCFTAIEGMASGKPLVVTDSGAMPELTGAGEVGIIVPKGDHNELARAIAKVLSDEADAQRLGQAARERVKALYTTEHWVSSIIHAYRRLIPSINAEPRIVEFPSVATVATPNGSAAERTAAG